MSAHAIAEQPPRWASAPGATIQRVLGSRGLSVEDLADALSISDPEARRLIAGEREISKDLAARLASALGSTPEFWATREAQYRDSLVWLEADELVQRSPLSYMLDLGWVERSEGWRAQAEALLKFYGVDSAGEWVSAWHARLAAVSFRTSPSFEADELSTAAWLRRVELIARGRSVEAWNPTRLRALLPKLRSLTRIASPEVFLPSVEALLSTAGVVLIVIPATPGNRLSGAALKVGKGPRVVALTGRHLAEDHLWFTLFHEIGHLLESSDHEEFVDTDDSDETADEQRADDFAREAILPAGLSGLTRRPSGQPTLRHVVSFASAQGIAPGLVVGRLHHEGILEHRQLRTLIRRYRWDGPTLKT